VREGFPRVKLRNVHNRSILRAQRNLGHLHSIAQRVDGSVVGNADAGLIVEYGEQMHKQRHVEILPT